MPKALFIDSLSVQFRAARSREYRIQPGIRAPMVFPKAPDFGQLMRPVSRWPAGGRPRHVHPGFVDDVSVSLDPLTIKREREYEFLWRGVPGCCGEQCYVGVIRRVLPHT